MAKSKKKSSLTLGRKKWATINNIVSFKLPPLRSTSSTSSTTKSPKKTSKRLLTPSKSPRFKASPGPSTKRFKTLKSPVAKKPHIKKTDNYKLTSRSLFGPKSHIDNTEDEIEKFINFEPQELQDISLIETEADEQNTSKSNQMLLSDVLSVLAEKDGLDEALLKFLQLVKERKFPLDNIAFLLWMEVVQWFDCKNTVQMRYSDRTKMFWKLGWRMFGGRFIHFMTGYKNREEIVLGVSKPGMASPQTSSINFAVPDMKVLRTYDKYNINESWTPGINTDVMQVIGGNLGHKSACLTYDGKKVKQGLTESSGDVDLLGYESGQTLQQKRDILNRAKEEIYVQCQVLTESEQSQEVTMLPENTKIELKTLILQLLKRVSECIIQVKELKRKKEYCKDKLIERSGETDWRKGKYVYAISGMMAFLYDIDRFLANAEIVRERLCVYMSYLNGSKYASGNTLNLSEHSCYVELPDLTDEVNTRLLKQRTDKWFELRKKALVTGSTLYRAVGCDSLAREKDHFESVVCGVPEKPFSENAKSAMKHGTDNEVNAVATVVGKIIPVLYPGAIFYEEGCLAVYTEENTGTPFLVVSPDGSLRENETFESTFAGIEIKCPVWKQQIEFPPRYILQCLSEIEVLNVDCLIYISWTEGHSNVFKVNRDKELFQKAMKISYSIYNGNSKKPTKLTDEQKSLKTEIVKKAKQVEFIGTFTSVVSDSSETTYSSETVSVGNVTELLESVNTLTSDHYELNRERASEAIVFIVADLDRSWDKENIRCAPVAWFPKGYSLDTSTMRRIADDVHTICHERNVHIPCESFDGQWHGIVVKSRNDQPLTILQLQKQVWQEAEKTKKSVIVSEVKKVNCSPRWDIATVCKNGGESRVIQSIKSEDRIPKWRPVRKTKEQKSVEGNSDNASKVTLIDVLPECVTNNIETSEVVLAGAMIDDHVQEEVFATNVDEQNWAEELEELLENHDQMDVPEESYPTSDIPDEACPADDIPEEACQTDDIHDEANPLDDDRDIITETEVIDQNAIGTESKSTNSLEREHVQNIPMISLQDAECILSLFKNTKNCNDKKKWTSVESSSLLVYFTSAKQLHRLRDIEIRVIVKYLKKTKAIKIKESSTKAVKIQELTKCLGIDLTEDSQIDENGTVFQARRISKKRYVGTLKYLAGNAVSKLPKHELNVAYADFIWPERFDTWKESLPLALDTEVNGSGYTWFYIPEFSEQRQQLEVRCIDSTHLLTRTRRKICKGGIEGLTNEPWIAVAKSGKTFLTPIMVTEITDPMSMDMAVTHISESVESVMRENGDDLAADLCLDLRNWWESEDRAGIEASERISKRVGLRKRLLSYVDFGQFPPPGSHINGWPQQLWEALLANMDAKILLYPLCHGGSYNTRAFSSMIGETFFSELTLNDRRGQGTVTCEEFGRFISNSTEQLQMRLDPERSFAYSTKRSTVYRLVEDTETYEHNREDDRCTVCESQGVSIPRCIVTKNHMFDNKGRKRLPGRRKQGTISTSRNAVQKGTLGVRWEKSRPNESKMLPTKRMGLD